MTKPFQNSSLSDSEIVFRQYYERLCYFAFQLINDFAIAEDLAQDAYLAYWNNKEKVSDHPTAIKDYLYSSVRNSCYNINRRKKVIERYLNSRTDDDFKEERIIHSIIESEVINNLYKAIDSLPEECKKVFKLGYIEGLNNSKIAEELNISINTVRSQKQRGLKTLRSQLNAETFLALILIFSR